MDFMLMDSAGNALAAFETRPEAIKAFQMLLGDDPTAKDEVALLAFNRLGFAVGEPLVAADVSPDTAVEVAITGAQWCRIDGTTFSSWATNAIGTMPLQRNEALAPVPRIA